MEENKIVYESILEFRIEKWIGIGSQSLVFKAVKKSVGRVYALKFQSKETYEDFEMYILKAYEKLQQGSVSKIAGLICDVPQEEMLEIFSKIPENIRNSTAFKATDGYFCIVEDYIEGCNLKEYCHGSKSKNIKPHCPGRNSSYAEVLSYQKDIFNWIIQFCDIMANVTDEKRVLHMDIKPENIMITNDTKSLILIDLGSTMFLDEGEERYDLKKDVFSVANLELYDTKCIGTMGFAAPEAYASTADRPQDMKKGQCGIIDQRSDIFSFGATLWDCITPCVIKVSYLQYYKRDLFAAPVGYCKELEEIIIKCTEKEPVNRFANFAELKQAAIKAIERLPSIYDKTTQRKICRRISLTLSIIAVLLMGISVGTEFYRFDDVSNKFSVFAEEYTGNDTNTYKQRAEDLVKTDASRTDSYDKILQLAYHDKNGVSPITNDEVNEALLPCLSQTQDSKIVVNYIRACSHKKSIKNHS